MLFLIFFVTLQPKGCEFSLKYAFFHYGQTDATSLLHPLRIPCRCDGEPAAHPRGAPGRQEVSQGRP